MKTKDLVCVLCPNGCRVEVILQQTPDLKVIAVKGCTCDKGVEWVEQEITNPMRTIASNIVVEKGDFKLVSVRTDVQIPLGKIFDVMDIIKKKKVTAPVKIGDKLIEKPGGIPCNIIATRNVMEKES